MANKKCKVDVKIYNIKQTKKVKSEKYFPPIGELKDLVVAEGFSAVGGISSVLGRQGIIIVLSSEDLLNTLLPEI